MALCSCLLCRKEISSRGIFVHFDRVHLGSAKYSSGHNGRYAEFTVRARKRHEASPVLCSCGKALTQEQRLAQNVFCSYSCAATRNNANRRARGWVAPLSQRMAISAALKGRTRVTATEVLCATCTKVFSYRGPRPQKRKYCSKACWKIGVRLKFAPTRPRVISASAAYRQACQFKFNVRDYPEEFNLELVRLHGWYSPSNRRGNLTGISRDHLFSVADGRRLGIAPAVMAHPANCQLLLHRDNKAKAHVSAISLEELMERIARWDTKYAKNLAAA